MLPYDITFMSTYEFYLFQHVSKIIFGFSTCYRPSSETTIDFSSSTRALDQIPVLWVNANFYDLNKCSKTYFTCFRTQIIFSEMIIYNVHVWLLAWNVLYQQQILDYDIFFLKKKIKDIFVWNSRLVFKPSK